MPLPPLPSIALSEVEDLTPSQPSGWMKLRRHKLRQIVKTPLGETLSEPFLYDSVDRVALDAVIIVPHHTDSSGARHVWLRSAMRPAAYMRPEHVRPFPEKATLGLLWEVPAGLVEPDETTMEGLKRCAARELEEELGFTIDPERFAALGPSTFPAPAIIAERMYFFHVEVDPDQRGEPSLDGSVLEQHAVITPVPLDEALTLLRRGEIEDAKTEIALRRLAEI